MTVSYNQGLGCYKVARTKELGRNGEPLCVEESPKSLVTSYISYTQILFCSCSLDPLGLNYVNSPHLGPYFQFLLFPKKLPASLLRTFNVFSGTVNVLSTADNVCLRVVSARPCGLLLTSLGIQVGTVWDNLPFLSSGNSKCTCSALFWEHLPMILCSLEVLLCCEEFSWNSIRSVKSDLAI